MERQFTVLGGTETCQRYSTVRSNVPCFVAGCGPALGDLRDNSSHCGPALVGLRLRLTGWGWAVWLGGQARQAEGHVEAKMRPGDKWIYVASLGGFLLALIYQVRGLGCFKCESTNHSNPDCEDTFNNTDNKYWVPDCWAARKGRKGLFPGTQCIKMIVEDDGVGKTYVVRGCVVDNGGTNWETEIGRLNHCGWLRTIEYLKIRRRGCILACETDGCNRASLPAARGSHVLWVCACAVLSFFLPWAFSCTSA